MVAVSDGRYRLLKRMDDERGELYDHAQDPAEQRDIAEGEPEVLERLTSELEAYLANSESPWGAAPDVELEAAELEQLRALGYAPE